MTAIEDTLIFKIREKELHRWIQYPSKPNNPGPFFVTKYIFLGGKGLDTPKMSKSKIYPKNGTNTLETPIFDVV